MSHVRRPDDMPLHCTLSGRPITHHSTVGGVLLVTALRGRPPPALQAGGRRLWCLGVSKF